MAVKLLLKCCIKWNSWLVKNNSITARVLLSAMVQYQQSVWFEAPQGRERERERARTQIHPQEVQEIKDKEHAEATDILPQAGLPSVHFTPDNVLHAAYKYHTSLHSKTKCK